MQESRDVAGKIFEIDRRERRRIQRVELHFVARRNAEQPHLSRRALDGNQPGLLLHRKRPRCDLRAEDQRERTRLRRCKIYAQLSRIGIETPLRDYGRRHLLLRPGNRRGIDHVGDRRALRHIERKLRKLALRRTDRSVMQPLDDSSSRRIELRQLRVEDRLFPRDIPAARLPRDPDFVHGR